MAGASAWIRRSLALTAVVLLGACAAAPAPLPLPAPNGVDLAAIVVADCSLERIYPTGKRHQSYVFECRPTRINRGWSDLELATFELYADFGGSMLLEDLKIDRRTGPWEFADGDAPQVQLEFELLAPERRRHAYLIGHGADDGQRPVVNSRVIGWSLDGGATWRTPRVIGQ